MRLLERERIEPTGQMKERKHRLQYTFFEDLYSKLAKNWEICYHHNPDKLVFTNNSPQDFASSDKRLNQCLLCWTDRHHLADFPNN